MADEVTDTPDPHPPRDDHPPRDELASLLEKHVARMEDITASGVKHMELVSGHLVSKLKRNIGLRSDVLDAALENLGIAPSKDDEAR